MYNLGVHTSLNIDVMNVPLNWIMYWSRQLERDRNQANLQSIAARNSPRAMGIGRRGRIG